MPFEVIHFRESETILKEKRLVKDVKETLEYIDDALYGSLYRRELLRQALDEMDWRDNGSLNIIDGRRYQYKGFKKGVALEGETRSPVMNIYGRAFCVCRWVLTRDLSKLEF